MNVIQNTELSYQDNKSDKVYIVNLVKDDSSSGYLVVCHYGRRGNSLQEAVKTNSPVPLAKAQSVYSKTVSEKMGKGYKLDSGVGGAAAASAMAQAKAQSGLMPQLLNPIDIKDAMAYINDDNYMCQEKHDGVRLMTRKSSEGIIGSNKLGLVTSISVTIHDSLDEISHAKFDLDGEGIGDHYYVFDVLSFGGQDYKTTPAIDRYNFLRKTFQDSKYIHVVETAFTREEKLAMYLRAMDEGWEGVVFKRKQSSYVEGRPNSGGDQLKLKFVESASCVVMVQNPTKRSVAIGFYINNILTEVGNVTIPPNVNVPEPQQIAEVRYLYATQSHALFQPVYLGVRDDIVHSECDVSQLKYKRELKAA
jgi:ATP-dependent DNA ligase